MFGIGKGSDNLDGIMADVKKQGESSGLNPLGTALEFDPTTGQFKTVPKLGKHDAGDIVTEMTEKGFANAED